MRCVILVKIVGNETNPNQSPRNMCMHEKVDTPSFWYVSTSLYIRRTLKQKSFRLKQESFDCDLGEMGLSTQFILVLDLPIVFAL